MLLLSAGKDRLWNYNMEMRGTLKLVTLGQITNGCGFELLLWTWLINLHPWHNEEGQLTVNLQHMQRIIGAVGCGLLPCQ